MAAEDQIRAFIAVEIGTETRERIRELIERLRKGVHFTAAQPKWSNADGIHLTLKFLGNITPAQVEPIAEVMKRVAANSSPFIYSTRGLGVFPHENRPRVLWVGIKRGAEYLCALQKRLESQIETLGFPPEEREFSPHLTLARFKSSQGARAMMAIVKSHNRFFCGETRVDRLTLFRSELRPEGARYSILSEAPLLGPPLDTEPVPEVESNEAGSNH